MGSELLLTATLLYRYINPEADNDEDIEVRETLFSNLGTRLNHYHVLSDMHFEYQTIVPRFV